MRAKKSSTTNMVAPDLPFHSPPSLQGLERRRYAEWAHPGRNSEYSAAIEVEGTRHFFPLQTDQYDQAVARRAELLDTLRRRGWNGLRRSASREITVAIFWLLNPVACTYTTLFTLPVTGRKTSPGSPTNGRHRVRVGLVEAEREIAAAVAHWIGEHPGFETAGVADSWSALDVDLCDVVLANRALPEIAGDERLRTTRQRHPKTAIFPLGIYPDSDSIFHSVSGVSRGYCFRRRIPTALFEPLGRWERPRHFTPSTAMSCIHGYFQKLFDPSPEAESSVERLNLTPRENEILQCLSRGLKDKEIASALQLSVWTVHGHVKSVFEKLHVHSRTEAVVKYLQK